MAIARLRRIMTVPPMARAADVAADTGPANSIVLLRPSLKKANQVADTTSARTNDRSMGRFTAKLGAASKGTQEAKNQGDDIKPPMKTPNRPPPSKSKPAVVPSVPKAPVTKRPAA